MQKITRHTVSRRFVLSGPLAAMLLKMPGLARLQRRRVSREGWILRGSDR